MTNQTTRVSNSAVFYLNLFVFFTLISARSIASQQQQQQQQQQQRTNQADLAVQLDQANGERVDQLASAVGDSFWHQSPEQLELILQSQLRRPAAVSANGYYVQPTSGQHVVFEAPTASNYHALVDEFKQYSRLANPLREIRAFRPKLMSTARGFGKRSYGGEQRITYSDLITAANPNGAILSNGKMNDRTLSSKYAEWIDQVLARWPTLNKYVNDKYLDYNGNMQIA